MANEITYTVIIKTADISNAGTDSNVNFILTGYDENDTKISTPCIVLNPLISGNAFERGQTDTITVKANEKITKLDNIMLDIVRYELLAPDWYVESISVSSPFLDEVKININGWIYPGEVNYFYPGQEYDCYLFEVKTADESSAGTDANITMYLEDASGKSTSPKAVNPYISGNAFEKGKTDTFYLTLTSLSNIRQLNIGTDMAYAAAGWKPSYVKVSAPCSPQPLIFTINEWIDDKSRKYMYKPD